LTEETRNPNILDERSAVRTKAIGLKPKHFVQLFEVRGGREGGRGVRRSGCTERHYIYYSRKGNLNGSEGSQAMPALYSDKDGFGGRDRPS
jgi:hypothetical protein